MDAAGCVFFIEWIKLINKKLMMMTTTTHIRKKMTRSNKIKNEILLPLWTNNNTTWMAREIQSQELRNKQKKQRNI